MEDLCPMNRILVQSESSQKAEGRWVSEDLGQVDIHFKISPGKGLRFVPLSELLPTLD